MAGKFPESIVEEAWRRTEGKCECKRTTHGHGARCHKNLYKWRRGDKGMFGCWEAHSVSGSYIPLPSDCQILCCDCYFATF